MLVWDIEQALALSEVNGYGFTDMSLKRGAVIQLCRRLAQRVKPRKLKLFTNKGTFPGPLKLENRTVYSSYPLIPDSVTPSII